MASYKVVIKRSAAKEIESIDRKKTRQRVVERIQQLATNPRPHGCGACYVVLNIARANWIPFTDEVHDEAVV